METSFKDEKSGSKQEKLTIYHQNRRGDGVPWTLEINREEGKTAVGGGRRSLPAEVAAMATPPRVSNKTGG